CRSWPRCATATSRGSRRSAGSSSTRSTSTRRRARSTSAPRTPARPPPAWSWCAAP
ncbi:MAG: hypothetical protein AVDCRST_MAG40-1823, partial [uncultured Gemmatimonadaceae bacterium]